MSTSIDFFVEATHDNQTWTRIPEGDYDTACSGWLVLLTGSCAEQPFIPMGHRGYPENLGPEAAALQLDLDGEFGNSHPFWFTLADVDRVEDSPEDFTMARWDYDKALTLDAAEPTLTAARDYVRKAGLRREQVRIIAVLS